MIRMRGGAGLDFASLRAEAGVPGPHPPAAVEEARRPPRMPDRDETAIPLFTIDPPGSMDLDQAMFIEARGRGYRVHYAIADLGAFVTPGGALDAASWERGVTYYAPDTSVPLYPVELSHGAASLLPDVERPAVLWTLDLDADGALERTEVARARVRSRAKLDYAGVQARITEFGALQAVGRLRKEREIARGGVSLPLPEQEVERAPDGWDVRYRAPLQVEDDNAQISLLTGMAGADLMLGAGVGILRTVPPADPRALERLRRSAAALGVQWIEPYPALIRSLDPDDPRHAALLHEATAVMRGAGYVAFDGAAPPQPRHSALAEEYAHVTAPLRRLADRYALECALAARAGERPPAWVTDRLAELPEAMKAADHRASRLERAAVDLVEAARLQGRVGEVFDAVVIDEGQIQLTVPAVRARCDGDPPVGERIRARLVEADPQTRRVRFERAIL